MFLTIKANYTHAVGLSGRLREVKLLPSIGYFIPILILKALKVRTTPSSLRFGTPASDIRPAPAPHPAPNTPMTISLTHPTTDPPTHNVPGDSPNSPSPKSCYFQMFGWVCDLQRLPGGRCQMCLPPVSMPPCSCEHQPFPNPIKNENFPISISLKKKKRNCRQEYKL